MKRTMAEELRAVVEELATTELELENAKSHVYRCDGCIQLLKHLIEQAESPDLTTSEEEVPAEG